MYNYIARPEEFFLVLVQPTPTDLRNSPSQKKGESLVVVML